MRELSARRFVIGMTVLLGVLAGCAGGPRYTSLAPSPEYAMRKVADRVLLDNPEPPPFDWGEGVLMAGMMRAGVLLDEPKYITFVRTWADHWNKQGLGMILEGGPRPDMPRYCGHWGPGYALLMLHERTGDRAYLDMARTIAEFIMTKATRTSDGGLAHWGGNKQLWVDTLYMAVPLLAELTRQTRSREFLNEGARQLDIYARHAQDEETGLFWHMYDEPSGKRMGMLWGRGNGWVAMSYVAALRQLDRRSPEYVRLSAQFRRQVGGLLEWQDRETRLWHTVIDRPETYLETSATAMILSSIVEAEAAGLLEINDRELVPQTWTALSRKLDGEGRVIDVSGGTGPEALAVYAGKQRGTYTWGTGAFLLAAAALRGE